MLRAEVTPSQHTESVDKFLIAVREFHDVYNQHPDHVLVGAEQWRLLRGGSCWQHVKPASIMYPATVILDHGVMGIPCAFSWADPNLILPESRLVATVADKLRTRRRIEDEAELFAIQASGDGMFWRPLASPVTGFDLVFAAGPNCDRVEVFGLGVIPIDRGV